MVDTGLQRVVVDSQLAGPEHKALRFTVVSKHVVVALVVVLLTAGCPAQVTRNIAEVIVYAVQRIAASWPWWDLCGKRREVKPCWMKRDAASAIVSPGMAARARAALYNVMMYSPQRRGSASLFMPVFVVHSHTLGHLAY